MLTEFVLAFWIVVAFGMVLSMLKFAADLAFKSADERPDSNSLEGVYR